MTKNDFDPYLNETFEVDTETVGVVKVELIETSEAKHHNMESFSVIFRGAIETPLQQKIHKLKHAGMGEIDLFLVPITYGKPGAMYYQAVFNRIVEKGE